MVEYSDGTKATQKQMTKDVVTFLMCSAEPHLESRHRVGSKSYYLLISSYYFSLF
jgi:Cytochrome c1